MTSTRWFWPSGSHAPWLGALLWLGVVLCVGACAESKALEPPSLTFAELRVVRSPVTVQEPDASKRPPHPRHRLVDGARATVEAGGLAWLRRDDGAVFLVRGPSTFIFGKDELSVDSGKVFASIPPGVVARVATPQGTLRLSRARVSIDAEAGESALYVLRGEVVTEGGRSARAGERLLLRGSEVNVSPEVAWTDWTGGLATTDESPAPPPFGVGTIGARPPGEQGVAREPLAVQRLALDVVLNGEFAVTTVDQVFFNAASSTVEGIYRFRTPEGAALLRFGVDRDGQLAWGRVKEKAAAAQQYESHVYEGSREDPALLEWVAPGEYQARIHPIEPGSVRRVVVRYSEWLPRMGEKGERRLYTYPMAAEGTEESLPRIEEFTATFDLTHAAAREVRSGMGGYRARNELVIRRHDFIPRADLAVELFDQGRTRLRAYQAEHRPDLEVLAPEQRQGALNEVRGEPDYLLLPLGGVDVPKPAPGLDLSIVVDTSAATEASSLALAGAATHALLEHLGEQDRAVVWTGADGLRPLVGGSGELSKVDRAHREAVAAGLATTRPGGATDLGLMLSQAAAVLTPDRAGAVVYIGDGAPTVGELSLDALSEKLSRLPRSFRVFALATGEGANLQVLDGIASGGFARRLSDRHTAAQTALEVLESVERPTALGLSVSFGPGVERVYPRGSAALTVDEGLLVIGRLVGKKPNRVTVTGPAGTRELDLSIARLEDRGDLRQRWAMGRLQELLAEGAGRAALVDLGMRYGIVTPTTSLYVPTRDELRSEGSLRARDEEREEREEATTPEQAAAELANNDEGGTGTRAKGEEGPTGTGAKPIAQRRFAVGGSRDDRPPPASAPPPPRPAPPTAAPAKQEEKQASAPRPASALTGGDPSAGELAEAPASAGGGLGLTGLGLIGHGAGGGGQGFGAGHGRLGGSHRLAAPKLLAEAATVTDGLPKEVVQRIVRQNFGRFRVCYESGLATNPNLRGRISTRFIIRRDGSVGSVSDGGSDLPDTEVSRCVQAAFSGLAFPQPENAVVSVVYPIRFEPGSTGEGAVPAKPAAPARMAPRPLGRVVAFGHDVHRCSLAASLPLSERAILWRERLAALPGASSRVAQVYRGALSDCEAPDFRSRARLFSLMLDALPEVRARVELWRELFHDLGARDALYRGVLARVKTAEELRELHDALGLASIEPGALEQLLSTATTPAERADVLQELCLEWPDDFALHLTLLESLEDAERFDAAREHARELRARPDATTELRTAVGEFHLRLSRRAATDERSRARAEEELAEAKRTFGEIVEFSPNDPLARRRLGDLLRAHGWYDEARRQYETLARLSPDDPTVGFLIAAAARGQGRLQEALGWLEEAAQAGDPDSPTGPASVGRALALAYLAWGREEARRENAAADAEILLERARRVTARGAGGGPLPPGLVRVTLSWAHPDFHPTLWTNALGSPMPAPEGDVTLGVARAVFPRKSDSFVEVRLDPTAIARMARYGAEAVLTVVFDELEANETIVRLPVRFQKDAPSVLRFHIGDREVRRG